MSAIEPKEKYMFQKIEFPNKAERDAYARGFFAGLKAHGGTPVEFE